MKPNPLERPSACRAAFGPHIGVALAGPAGRPAVGPAPKPRKESFQKKMPKRFVFSTFCACTQVALAEPVGAEPGFVFCDFRLPAEIAKNKTNILIAHQ